MLVTVALEITPHGQAPAGNASTVLQIKAVSTADIRTWDAFITEGRRAGDLQLQTSGVDPMVPGHRAERFTQSYQGVPIWGSDIVRDSDNGVVSSIFGVLSPTDLQVDVTPGLSADDARAAMQTRAGVAGSVFAAPTLTIARLDTGRHALAYTAVVSSEGSIDRVFVDATTGAEVMRYSAIQSQTASVGTGTGVLGDRKKLSVESNGSTYNALDHLRPPVIVTYDMKGNLAATRLVTENNGALYTTDRATDSDNVWTDPAVVDAHVHVAWTYDYFFKRFNRSGLDGANGPIKLV